MAKLCSTIRLKHTHSLVVATGQQHYKNSLTEDFAESDSGVDDKQDSVTCRGSSRSSFLVPLCILEQLFRRPDKKCSNMSSQRSLSPSSFSSRMHLH